MSRATPQIKDVSWVEEFRDKHVNQCEIITTWPLYHKAQPELVEIRMRYYLARSQGESHEELCHELLRRHFEVIKELEGYGVRFEAYPGFEIRGAVSNRFGEDQTRFDGVYADATFKLWPPYERKDHAKSDPDPDVSVPDPGSVSSNAS